MRSSKFFYRGIRGTSGKFCVSAAMVLAAAMAAQAQVWTESPDAPELQPGQMTLGVGPLTTINGSIFNPDVDADLYCIHIPDMALFLATTTKSAGLFVPDPQLFLFTTNGVGIVYDTNIVPGTATISGGLLPNPSLYPAGDYLLGYSASDKDPYDSPTLANMIFPDIAGPQQLALITTPLAAWDLNGSASPTSYTITLTGAEYCGVPEPQTLGLLSLGCLTAMTRRRWWRK